MAASSLIKLDHPWPRCQEVGLLATLGVFGFRALSWRPRVRLESVESGQAVVMRSSCGVVTWRVVVFLFLSVSEGWRGWRGSLATRCCHHSGAGCPGCLSPALGSKSSLQTLTRVKISLLGTRLLVFHPVAAKPGTLRDGTCTEHVYITYAYWAKLTNLVQLPAASKWTGHLCVPFTVNYTVGV